MRLRQHETGIRLARGAHRADILRRNVGYGRRLTAAGLVLGVLGALDLSRYLAAVLFEVTLTDPLTFAGVILTVATAALAASWFSARRAASLEPAKASHVE